MKIIRVIKGKDKVKEEVVVKSLKGRNAHIMLDLLMHDPKRREQDTYKVVCDSYKVE